MSQSRLPGRRDHEYSIRTEIGDDLVGLTVPWQRPLSGELPQHARACPGVAGGLVVLALHREHVVHRGHLQLLGLVLGDVQSDFKLILVIVVHFDDLKRTTRNFMEFAKPCHFMLLDLKEEIANDKMIL